MCEIQFDVLKINLNRLSSRSQNLQFGSQIALMAREALCLELQTVADDISDLELTGAIRWNEDEMDARMLSPKKASKLLTLVHCPDVEYQENVGISIEAMVDDALHHPSDDVRVDGSACRAQLQQRLLDLLLDRSILFKRRDGAILTHVLES